MATEVGAERRMYLPLMALAVLAVVARVPAVACGGSPSRRESRRPSPSSCACCWPPAPSCARASTGACVRSRRPTSIGIRMAARAWPGGGTGGRQRALGGAGAARGGDQGLPAGVSRTGHRDGHIGSDGRRGEVRGGVHSPPARQRRSADGARSDGPGAGAARQVGAGRPAVQPARLRAAERPGAAGVDGRRAAAPAPAPRVDLQLPGGAQAASRRPRHPGSARSGVGGGRAHGRRIARIRGRRRRSARPTSGCSTSGGGRWRPRGATWTPCCRCGASWSWPRRMGRPPTISGRSRDWRSASAPPGLRSRSGFRKRGRRKAVISSELGSRSD